MTSHVASLVRLLRPEQWIKNVFVLAPLFFSEAFYSPSSLTRSLGVTAAFCLIASAIYVMNDWRDRNADKLHPVKRLRAIASKAVGGRVAFALISLLSPAAFVIAIMVDLSAALLIAIYVLINIAYSFGLKTIPIVELFVVSAGYVIRLAVGAAAINVSLSHWIMIATGLLALLLTVGKRRADIVAQPDAPIPRPVLNAYSLPFLNHLLTALAAAIVVVYLLFCGSDYAIGRFGINVFATAPFVLGGIARYMQLAFNDGAGASPTDLVVSDWGLRFAIAGYIMTFFIILYFRDFDGF